MVVDSTRPQVLAALHVCLSSEYSPDSSLSAKSVVDISIAAEIEDQAAALRRLVKAQAA
jgi:hypothetical protein